MFRDNRLRAELLRVIYSGQKRPGLGSIWSPLADVFHSGEALVVRLEVAGMSREDFNITLQNRRLVVTGERIDPMRKQGFYSMAVPFGRFAAELELPDLEYNREAVKAVYENGFLIIEIPTAKGAGKILKIK